MLVKASRNHDGVTLRNVSPYLHEVITATKLSHVLHVDGSDLTTSVVGRYRRA